MSELLALSIGIQARPSALDPDACAFRVSRSMLAGGAVEFRPGDRDARLVAALEELDGVAAADLAENVAMVRKDAAAAWNTLVPAIAATIRTHVAAGPTGEPVKPEDEPAAGGPRSSEAVLRLARELVESQFNPAIASHGGEIRVIDFGDGQLHVEMLGGCQGCAASQMTLRQGLTSLIRQHLPEVRDIVDATDHAAGASPYYAKAGPR